MQELVINAETLLFRVYNRFFCAVEQERIAYTQKMEAAEQEQMTHCRERFQELMQARRGQPTEDTALTTTGVQRALKTVRLAKKTGML